MEKYFGMVWNFGEISLDLGLIFIHFHAFITGTESVGGLNPDHHPYMRQWVGELEAIAPVGDKIHFRICVADLVFQNKLI